MSEGRSPAVSRLVRTTPQLVLILIVAGVAASWVVGQARSMGAMPGAMGMGLPAFVAMWTVMMSAMMLPSVAPLASTYSRMIVTNRARRLTMFTIGYLLVWGLSGVPAFGLAWAAGKLSSTGGVGIALASGVFIIAGVYQLTPLKYRCLSHCRTPLSEVLRYASFRGPTRDVKAGLNSGFFCLGCCWSLMLLMAAFGVMNIYGMAGLAAVVAVEKLTPAGERFSKGIGVGLLILAIVVIWVPGVAPGLTGG
jgi:predicted metal-binding membrane protein